MSTYKYKEMEADWQTDYITDEEIMIEDYYDN